jgi:threonyl-tRNA synthetase
LQIQRRRQPRKPAAFPEREPRKAVATGVFSFWEIVMPKKSLAPRSSDHRQLGRELELFTFDPAIGPGLPLWLPKGTVVRDEIERLAKELEFAAGFERVATPHLARSELYRQSGHLPYFAPDMYPGMDVREERDGEAAAVKDEYVLRPMNCPHHHRVFAARPRSYRDLPVRLAEYGQVYRWERSGALSGLARVRGMCMNDGHIYCTPEQVERELHAVLDMHAEIYRLLGIERYRLRLSRRDPRDPRGKYVDDPAAWQWAERLLERLLQERGVEFIDGVGHAAFYGPKIDVQVTNSLGAEETLSTVQVDFAQPRRLGLGYVAASGELETPLCIHRAPFSTHERFVAFLLELFGGALPLWLSPVQLLVIAVAEPHAAYAAEVVTRLRARGIRAERASVGQTVANNVRIGAARKIPLLGVVGAREQAERTVAVRRHGDRAQASLSLDALEVRLLAALAKRDRSLSLSGDAAAVLGHT